MGALTRSPGAAVSTLRAGQAAGAVRAGCKVPWPAHGAAGGIHCGGGPASGADAAPGLLCWGHWPACTQYNTTSFATTIGFRVYSMIGVTHTCALTAPHWPARIEYSTVRNLTQRSQMRCGLPHASSTSLCSREYNSLFVTHERTLHKSVDTLHHVSGFRYIGKPQISCA